MSKNIAIVCNKIAGAGRSLLMTEKIALALSKSDHLFSVFTGDWPHEFDNFTDVFIVGGDGTMNYFVNKYPDINKPLVLFNGGTGNDFYWTLYNNKSFEELMQIALSGTAKPIDIGKCNENYFLNGVGIGFEASISKELTGKKKLQGKKSFYISVLKNIFTYKSRSYSVQLPTENFEGKYLLIDIYNGKRAGGGFYIAPQAEPDDGLFEVIIAEKLNAFQRLRYLPVIEKGRHLKLPFIKYFRTGKIKIESDHPIQYHLDGEYAQASKLDISIVLSRLNVRY